MSNKPEDHGWFVEASTRPIEVDGELFYVVSIRKEEHHEATLQIAIKIDATGRVKGIDTSVVPVL